MPRGPSILYARMHRKRRPPGWSSFGRVHVWRTPRRRAATSARAARCAEAGTAASSPGPCGHACTSSPATEARSSCSNSTETVSPACGIAPNAERKKRFKTVELIVAELDWDPPATRLMTRRGRPHRLCRSGTAATRETSRWKVEPRPQPLGAAVRPRRRARPGIPDRREAGIQYWMPSLNRKASTWRCAGDLHTQMLTSNTGCKHPMLDSPATRTIIVRRH